MSSSEGPPRKLTFGQRSADFACQRFGSWGFIWIQLGFFVGWILYNRISSHPFDPYPWLLLNLALSFCAAFANPMLQLSQNRLGDGDRDLAKLHFELSQRAEERAQSMQRQLELMTELLGQLADRETPPG